MGSASIESLKSKEEMGRLSETEDLRNGDKVGNGGLNASKTTAMLN